MRREGYGVCQSAFKETWAACTYLTNVMADTMAMAAAFWDKGQFMGFAGSSGPSQSTTVGSRAVVESEAPRTEDAMLWASRSMSFSWTGCRSWSWGGTPATVEALETHSLSLPLGGAMLA